MHHVHRAITLSILLLLTLLRPAITEAQEQRKNIAVLDAILLDNSPSWNRAVQRGMTDTIIGYFVREGSYNVLDRGSYDQIATELDFQSRGFVDDAQVQQFGRQTGAEYIVVIRVGEPTRDRFIVTASIMHVETGKVIDQVSEMRSGTVDVLFDLANVVGAELTGTTAAITGQPQSRPSRDRQTSIFSGLTYDLGLLYGIGVINHETNDGDVELYWGYDSTFWDIRLGVQSGMFAIRPTLGITTHRLSYVSYERLRSDESITHSFSLPVSEQQFRSLRLVVPITLNIVNEINPYVGVYGSASGFGVSFGANAGLNLYFNRFIIGFDSRLGYFPVIDATEMKIGLFSGWRF